MEESKSTSAGNGPLISGGIDLIGQSFTIFSKKWKKLVWLLFVIPIILAGLSILVGLSFAGLSGLVITMKMASLWKIILAVILGIIGVACILFAIFISIVSGVGSVYVIDGEVSVKEALKKSASLFWRYLGLIILLGIIVGIGFILFIVPGIILMIMLSFATYILVLEGLGPIQSLKRSKELVKGFWWTILARFMVIGIFSLLLSIVSSIINSIGTSLIQAGGKNVIAAIVIVIIAVISFVLYMAINFVVNSVAMIYGYLIYGELKKLKDSNASIRDNMSGGKKFGLGLLLAAIAILVIVVMIVFMVLASLGTTMAGKNVLKDIKSGSSLNAKSSLQLNFQSPQAVTPKINK